MLLSYWLRLVCLLLFSLGLIQAALSLLLELLAPALDHALARLSARWFERACFALPIAPHLAAFMLAAVAIAPQYIRGETDLLSERVGIVCVVGALLAAARYAYALLRALRLMRSLMRGLMRGSPACREGSGDAWAAGVPIRIVDSRYPILMVTGLFRPAITVSRRLLGHAGLSPEALDVAFAHEFAHVRHFDNLKLFMLSSLALPVLGSAGVQRWRRAAEVAADNDAVAGSRARAILLAETLLVAAAMPPKTYAAAALGLLSHEEDLQHRIHRLLEEKSKSVAHGGVLRLLTASMVLLYGASLLRPLALVSFHGITFHGITEFVLHL